MGAKPTRWSPERVEVAKQWIRSLGSVKAAAEKLGTTDAALRGMLRVFGVKAGDLLPIVPPAPPSAKDEPVPAWQRYKPRLGWQEPVRSKPAKGQAAKTVRTLVFADAHHPYVSEPAWNCLLGIIRDVKPDRVVNLGDFMDMESLSRHPKSKPDLVRLSSEYYAANVALDEVQNAAPGAEHYYIEGNHEGRAGKFTNEFGTLDGMLSVAQSLFLEPNPDHYHRRSSDNIRGMKWIPLSMQPFGIDGVGYLHGLSETKHHAAYTAETEGPARGHRLLMYGHMHAAQSYTSSAGFQARSCPWLGNATAPVFRAYVKGRSRPWSHGVELIESCDGAVSVTSIPIVNGRALVGGKALVG